MAKLYIGEKEIKEIVDTVVTYKDDSTETFTERQLEYIVTKETKDLSEFMALEVRHIVSDVMDTLETHNIKKGLIQKILEEVVSRYNLAYSVAIGKAF